MRPEGQSRPAALSAVPAAASSATRALADWVELTKPRIASFVVLAAFVGALLGAGGAHAWADALAAAVLIGCVAAASSVLNQVLERDTDALMERTRERPLPAGRLSVAGAVWFAAALAVVGVTGLALGYGVLTALLSLSTLCAYVLVYTPLKRHSPLNTLVGAVPGAMPPLLGHVALAPEGHGLGGWGIVLFAVVFAWQFPHFMAIAWLHRADYARAGMRMIPALAESRGLAGRQALLYGLALVPVSVLPALDGGAGALYGLGALGLGLGYLAAAAAFALREDERRARTLLLASLVYLPAVLCLAVFDPTVALFTAS